MAKDLCYTMLFDAYGALLTEKQRETLEMYYNDDLSLGEISEETGITRQGVMNCIKVSEQRLTEFENQLGIVTRFNELKNNLDLLEELISAVDINETSRDRIYDIIGDIRSRL